MDTENLSNEGDFLELKVYEFGPYTLDARSHKREIRLDGKPLATPLTNMEYSVLTFLISKKGSPVAPGDFPQFPPKSDLQDQHPVVPYFSKIKSKMGEQSRGYIRNTRSAGYWFAGKLREMGTQPMRNRIEGVIPLSTNLWHLPEPRNPLFKGRERELENLHHESLDKASRRVVQVLAALRGLGASSLAVEYAYRFRDQYDLVWWFDATSPAEVTKQYDVLAKNFNRSYTETNLGAIDYVSNRLANFPNWLIIFDNVISAEDIAGLLPRTGAGHIIVTATDRNWGGTATIYDLQPLDYAAAVSFLNARLIGLQSNSDKELIPELATELQCMPLALEVASAYIDITCCTISVYLDRLRALRAKSERLFQFDRSVEVVVAETWRLTLTRAVCESPGVYILFRVVSWFDDCEIPLDFISAMDSAEHEIWDKLHPRITWVVLARLGRRRLPDPKPPLPTLRRSRYVHTFTEALGRLRQYSVATQSESAFIIPPLAKIVGRNRQWRSTKLKWLRFALFVAAFCAWESIDRTELSKLTVWAQHIMRAIEHGAELGMSETDEAWVFGVETLKCIVQKGEDPTCTPRMPPQA